jgi:hypothetical protein
VVLDLFERRLKAYTALREVLRKIKSSGRASNEDGFEFREAVNDAEFLFGMEIITQLHKIQEIIWDLQQVQGAENGESVRRSRLSERRKTMWSVITRNSLSPFGVTCSWIRN